jgi:hypothetical protein|tara:strand:- start:837 stop:947 length:111 start_codon:yes stop_codon:yes gene_type:complete
MEKCKCGLEDWFSYINWSDDIETIETNCAKCGGVEK